MRNTQGIDAYKDKKKNLQKIDLHRIILNEIGRPRSADPAKKNLHNEVLNIVCNLT